MCSRSICQPTNHNYFDRRVVSIGLFLSHFVRFSYNGVFVNVSVRYKEQSQKVNFRAWKCFLKWVWAFGINRACVEKILRGNI